MLRAGMDTKAVLQKCMDSILGSALPYEQTSDAELKALAHAVTTGGIIQRHFSGVRMLAIQMSHINEHDVLPQVIAHPQSCTGAPVLSTQPRSTVAGSEPACSHSTLCCIQRRIGTGCIFRRW